MADPPGSNISLRKIPPSASIPMKVRGAVLMKPRDLLWNCRPRESSSCFYSCILDKQLYSRMLTKASASRIRCCSLRIGIHKLASHTPLRNWINRIQGRKVSVEFFLYSIIGITLIRGKANEHSLRRNAENTAGRKMCYPVNTMPVARWRNLFKE